jgi:hypothetical protein
MQLETFGVFYDLAQTRSLTATARHFGLTQNAARRQLALLERQFKTRLADCRRQKIRLTPEGRVCSRYCARMVATLRRLDAALQQARELAANEFHLAVCFSIGFHQLPARLRRFQAAHPAARVTVSYGTPARVHQAVGNLEADLGLTIHPQHRPGLVLDLTRREPLTFVCHPQHPLAGEFVVAVGDGAFEVAHGETRFLCLLVRVCAGKLAASILPCCFGKIRRAGDRRSVFSRTEQFYKGGVPRAAWVLADGHRWLAARAALACASQPTNPQADLEIGAPPTGALRNAGLRAGTMIRTKPTRRVGDRHSGKTPKMRHFLSRKRAFQVLCL